jgi:hypothetical protein
MHIPDLSDRFTFRFTPGYQRAARPFGITPATAEAVVDATRLAVRFGPWRLSTPLKNIACVEVTGPYAFWKTAGPARLAVTDRGLTFATNSERGVLVSFHRPVAAIEPTGLLRHPELTLTVSDIDGLIRRLTPHID